MFFCVLIDSFRPARFTIEYDLCLLRCRTTADIHRLESGDVSRGN